MNGANLPLVLVAALAENNVIGDDNRLIWRLKSDLKRFKALTLGKPMIMGRKTFLSIGKPLPGRTTIVVTRDRGFSADGVIVAHDIPDAIRQAAQAAADMKASEIIVAGGADIYRQMIPDCARMHLTIVHARPAGDALFPDFDRQSFIETHREAHPAGPDDEFPFTFIDFTRRETAPGR